MRMILAFLRGRWLSISLISGFVWIVALRLYYWIKPSLPALIRLSIRRWWALRKRTTCAGQWPILECAGAAPNDWTGWPKDRQFAFVLTHDVESQRGWRDAEQVRKQLDRALIFTVFEPAMSFGQPASGRAIITFANVEVTG